jgi:hypothetical protein
MTLRVVANYHVIVNNLSHKHAAFSMFDLFNFSKDHWVKCQEASAIGSLEEELELYQLLDWMFLAILSWI